MFWSSAHPTRRSEACNGDLGHGRAYRFEDLFGSTSVNRRPDRYEPVTPAASGPEERAIDADDHSRIRGALTMLSVKDRELLWLREVEGLSYEEIGGRLSAATGTIRVACHRARKKLEQAYQEEGI